MVDLTMSQHVIIWLASGFIYQVFLEIYYDHKFYTPGLFEYFFSCVLGPINYVLALGNFIFNKE